MKKIALIFVFLFALPGNVSAHKDVYHNYAGLNIGFLLLVLLLVGSLLVYEKVRGSVGRGVLVSAILISFFVPNFSPLSPNIGMLGYSIIFFLIVFSFVASFVYKKHHK